MDDCNTLWEKGGWGDEGVQIPLWTIVTAAPDSAALTVMGSDSSMDDCNGVFEHFAFISVKVQIPLWTIVTPAALSSTGSILRSDSSMDDCNPHGEDEAGPEYEFRFLYGRL